jgi:leucine dehydrogenase
MLQIKDLKIEGYYRVVEAQDPAVGLHCFIALHDCTLGPAAGGTRIYPYRNREEALEDALRLAKTMTYKAAVVQVGLGGGKGVIIGDPARDKTEQLLLSYADVVNSLKGEFVTGENMGTTIEDVNIMHKKTPYVVAYSKLKGSADPTAFTAWGIFKGMQAVAQTLWGTPSLQDKEILIQGLGGVGSKLANLLFWEGAQLLFAEVDTKKLHELAHFYGAKIVSVDDFYSVPCDILSPCAKGPIITEQNIHQLRCKAITGAANSQLQDSNLGQVLKEKRILYAPDFIINAGGVIDIAMELEPEGYHARVALRKVNTLYDRLLTIFEKAERENQSTLTIAEEMAEYNIKHLIGKRSIPPIFNRK